MTVPALLRHGNVRTGTFGAGGDKVAFPVLRWLPIQHRLLPDGWHLARAEPEHGPPAYGAVGVVKYRLTGPGGREEPIVCIRRPGETAVERALAFVLAGGPKW